MRFNQQLCQHAIIRPLWRVAQLPGIGRSRFQCGALGSISPLLSPLEIIEKARTHPPSY